MGGRGGSGMSIGPRSSGMTNMSSGGRVSAGMGLDVSAFFIGFEDNTRQLAYFLA